MANPPSINYTAKDFSAIHDELSAFVLATRPDDWNDYFQSSLGTALIDLICYSHDILSYAQDAVAQEVFLSTARRYDTALRFAKSVGYVPSMSKSSTVVVTASTLSSAITASGATLAAGQTITGLNGLSYELVEDAAIAASTSSVALTLSEGKTVTEAFTPSTLMWQVVTTDAKDVEHDSYSVFVGDPTSPANKWVKVSALAFEVGATNTFESDFDEDGRLLIKFGDGVSGRIPVNDISLIFRTCSGQAGNASVATILGSFTAAITGGTTTASVDVTNLTRATGGADREGVESLRRSVPAYLRTQDTIITLDDYERLIPIGTAVSLCFADVPLASTSGNIVRLSTWDATTASFTSTSKNTARSSTEDYASYTLINSARANEIQTYLATRTISCVHNVIALPTTASVSLEWDTIRYHPNYDAVAIHSAVTKAIIGVFTAGSGFKVSLSDLYSAVLVIDGVLEATLSKITYAHNDWADNGASPATITEIFTALGTEAGVTGALRDITVPRIEDRKYYDSSLEYDGEVTYQDSIDNVNVQAINLTALTFDLTI
jgi:hypothetical protein